MGPDGAAGAGDRDRSAHLPVRRSDRANTATSLGIPPGHGGPGLPRRSAARRPRQPAARAAMCSIPPPLAGPWPGVEWGRRRGNLRPTSLRWAWTFSTLFNRSLLRWCSECLKAELGVSGFVSTGASTCSDCCPKARSRQVRAEVRRYCDTLGRDGGYILGPCGPLSSPTCRRKTCWRCTPEGSQLRGLEDVKGEQALALGRHTPVLRGIFLLLGHNHLVRVESGRGRLAIGWLIELRTLRKGRGRMRPHRDDQIGRCG